MRIVLPGAVEKGVIKEAARGFLWTEESLVAWVILVATITKSRGKGCEFADERVLGGPSFVGGEGRDLAG